MKIKANVTKEEVADWRWRFECALALQKDGRDNYYMTPDLVKHVSDSLGDDYFLDGVVYERSIMDNASFHTLKYRTFYPEEIKAYREKFINYLSNKLKEYNIYSEANIKKYTKPLTIEQIRENLHTGYTPNGYLEDLYDVSGFGDWEFR